VSYQQSAFSKKKIKIGKLVTAVYKL